MIERPRTTATVLLAVCLVLSGCTGGPGDTMGATTDSADSSPTSVPATTTTTSVEAGTTDTSVESPPLADGTVAEDHAAVLRQANNFTLETNVTMTGTETEEIGFLNTTIAVDASSKSFLRQISKHNLASQTTYRTPDGKRYQRTQYYEGQSPEYRRVSFGKGVGHYVKSAPTWFVEAYDYTYEGKTTRNGESVHVYSVTSVEQLINRSATYAQYNPKNVTALDIRIFVTEEGLAAEQQYRLVREVSGERVTLNMRIEYVDLGATKVEPPSWLDEAKEQTEARTTVPDPSREVTETVSEDSLGAAVTVTGPKHGIEHVELERQTGGIWDTGGDGYRKAQVSSLVKVELGYNADLNVTKFELSYNESTVPAGDEAGLDVYRYNRTLQTFVEVENTIDTDANVARAEIQGEGTYLVMHTPTWRDLFRS